MTDIVLVAMRLKDMWKVHPDQDSSRVCSKCGEAVGIYPSGQNELAHRPDMKIICLPCSNPQPGDDVLSAGTLGEIKRELRDSVRRQ
jgi:hypothetical protein